MYKYGSKVRVTSGFYEGMEGTVLRQSISFESQWNTASSIQEGIKPPKQIISYICDLKDPFCHCNIIKSDYIPESSLELIK